MADIRENTLFALLLSSKATEVFGAYHLPLTGIDQLRGEFVIYLLPALGINERLDLLPCADKIYNLIHTSLLAVFHFRYECTAAFHRVVPWQMVEPQQILLGACGGVVIQCAVGLWILQRGA